MPAVRDLPHDQGFVEIADRVWVARHSWFDVNVSVVAGARGLLVVDTHASERAARSVVEDLRRSVGGEVVAVMNTHEHFDHSFGNGAFRSAYPGVPLIAHEEAAARTTAAGERIKGLYAAQFEAGEPDDPHRDEVEETEIVPADTTFSSVLLVDLGDRAVELVHPGPGHTSGDVVARVEDADVLFAGDLVEESAERGGVPGYGADSHPMSWPLTLDLVLSLVGNDTVVVPGHGNPVDRAFVEEQRSAIGVVAETIRDLAGRGVSVDDALTAGDWPYPREHLADAVRRGYAELPRSARHLPLI
jgi:glyoxylase-like metal-dependent hydrolase (beta-lactamase superfamily II)